LARIRVAAVVPTYMEEARIGWCLGFLKPHLDYILVVDDRSTDRTVEVASHYADQVIVKEPSHNQAETRNFGIECLPHGYDWTLHVDADEKFDEYFLRTIHTVPELDRMVDGFQFARVNLPDARDWPDYQVRFIRNTPDIRWRGHPHDKPYKGEVPLIELGTVTIISSPIIHLPRRTDIQRPWWRADDQARERLMTWRKKNQPQP